MNAILGYAQILEGERDLAERLRELSGKYDMETLKHVLDTLGSERG